MSTVQNLFFGTISTCNHLFISIIRCKTDFISLIATNIESVTFTSDISLTCKTSITDRKHFNDGILSYPLLTG
ncbi:hypothetical protein DSUL_60055 [Desulfovibrionales bacterium]